MPITPRISNQYIKVQVLEIMKAAHNNIILAATITKSFLFKQ